MACVLCDTEGGWPVWRGPQLRVIRAQEPGFPVFYRVIWNAHVAEFSDLSQAERGHCMDAVTLVERTLKAQWPESKINLAALGNVVPHLHWHVVARFDWDSHFPAPLWAQPLRAAPQPQLVRLQEQLPALDAHLRQQLTQRFDNTTPQPAT